MSELYDFGLRPGEARLNITWNGQNGDLPDAVDYDATQQQLRGWAEEAIRAGSIPGVRADRGADLSNFVVDRFPATPAIPYARVMLRPKTPFG